MASKNRKRLVSNWFKILLIVPTSKPLNPLT